MSDLYQGSGFSTLAAHSTQHLKVIVKELLSLMETSIMFHDDSAAVRMLLFESEPMS